MTRLAAKDWLDAGIAALQATGPAALKADTLSKAIGVTRGSFYWHFADLEAFHQAVLRAWQESALQRLAETLQPGAGDPLERLLRRAFTDQGDLEVAVRAWAIGYPAARTAVAAVDTARVAQLHALLVVDGMDAEVADARARALNWTYLGIALSTATPSLRTTLRIVKDVLEFVRAT